jgi:hypothetical protein
MWRDRHSFLFVGCSEIMCLGAAKSNRLIVHPLMIDGMNKEYVRYSEKSGFQGQVPAGSAICLGHVTA